MVKADGLAAGKGVYICADEGEAVRALEECLVAARFGEAGATVVVEEFLNGEELSLFCLTDGRAVLPLAPAQDFKRALDGDEGPNTGGMGAYSPVPHMPADVVDRSVREIFEPVVRQLEREGARFQGLLYGGLMVTADGPKVVEFNCRFGDPETQVVLPRMESDLAEPMLACAEGNLAPYAPRWRPEACVTVVLASGGYPGDYDTGKEIKGGVPRVVASLWEVNDFATAELMKKFYRGILQAGLRPAAAIGRSRKETLPRLLDHVVRAQQQRLRDRESERSRGLEVDHELELGGLFDWQITGFCALENLVHVAGGAPK